MAEEKVIRFYGASERWGELSNFWPLASPLRIDGLGCPTSEHAYQMKKFLYEDAPPANRDYAAEIAAASTPYKAKLLGNQRAGNQYSWQVELGRTIERYRARGVAADPGWEARKDAAMREVLFAKFRADLHCRTVLLSTRGCALEEASSRDAYWGRIGTGAGLNRLGTILAEVRETIARENK